MDDEDHVRLVPRVECGLKVNLLAGLLAEQLRIGCRNLMPVRSRGADAEVEPAGDGFSFFVVYASTAISLDFAEIEVPEVKAPQWSAKEVNTLIKELLGRRLVVVGACTGSACTASTTRARANSGSSCDRTTTFTESIWMRPTRNSKISQAGLSPRCIGETGICPHH